MNHVYLLPHDDGTYEVCIQPSSPCESAVLLTPERKYPIEYIFRRLDLNGSLVYESYTCANREELLRELNYDGEALHTIMQLWDFSANKAPIHDAWEVFNAATNKLMEILMQIDPE